MHRIHNVASSLRECARKNKRRRSQQEKKNGKLKKQSKVLFLQHALTYSL